MLVWRIVIPGCMRSTKSLQKELYASHNRARPPGEESKTVVGQGKDVGTELPTLSVRIVADAVGVSHQGSRLSTMGSILPTLRIVPQGIEPE